MFQLNICGPTIMRVCFSRDCWKEISHIETETERNQTEKKTTLTDRDRQSKDSEKENEIRDKERNIQTKFEIIYAVNCSKSDLNMQNVDS